MKLLNLALLSLSAPMITASPSATIATFPPPAEDPYEVTTPWGARIGAWAVCEPSGARDDQYSWTRDGAVIPGIRSHWYFLTIADEGTYLRCGPADGAGPMSPEVCIGTCLNNRGDGAQDDEPVAVIKPPPGGVAPAPTIPAPTTGAPTGRPTVSSSPSISSSPTEMPSVAPSRKPKSTKAPTTKSTKAPTTATTRSSKSTKAAKSAKSLKAAKGET